MTEKTWIILDDDDGIMSVFEAMCKIWQVSMIKLRDGYDAMKWIAEFRAGLYVGPLPELALLDIRMPGPQGYQVAHELRKIPDLNEMAIVLMTAYRLSHEELEGVIKISDADQLFHKPIPNMFDFNNQLQVAIDARKEHVKKGAEGQREADPIVPLPDREDADENSIPARLLTRNGRLKRVEYASAKPIMLLPEVLAALERAATASKLSPSDMGNLLVAAGLNVLSQGKLDSEVERAKKGRKLSEFPDIPDEYR
jgi:CheY-like chemotaxis protein